MLIIGCIVLSAWCTMAQTTGIPASDTRFVFVGRTMVDSASVSMDWTGSYARVYFYGDTLRVRISDTGTSYYNLYIDRAFSAIPDQVLQISGDTTCTLFASRWPEEHRVLLYKRTEGEQGRTTFHEFLVHGEILQAEPLKERQIEFIGDSYTCGYGAENSGPGDRFQARTETSAKSYAAIVARYFNADFMLVAHSGMGIARNYNSKFPNWYMPDRYLQTFDMDSTEATRWDAASSDFSPAISIILLGGNDFSRDKHPSYQDFSANYYRLISEIKANYGTQHPVLCCVKKGNDLLFDYIRQVVNECEWENVSFCPFFPSVFLDDERNLGADRHPNYEGHRKAAHVMIPYISTLTDWPLTYLPVQ